MSVRTLVTLSLLMAASVVWGAAPGAAHDPYTHWRQPGTGASCCNQMTPDRSAGDCRPVHARLDAYGTWWVKLDSGWRAVPRARILPQASPDLSSHVCANLSTEEIYCFVPGPQGS